MRDLNRKIAELLGWEKTYLHNIGEVYTLPRVGFKVPTFDTDANQIDAAIREWCGSDEKRWDVFGIRLQMIVLPEHVGWLTGNAIGLVATATPEQKCHALIAASAEAKEGWEWLSTAERT